MNPITSISSRTAPPQLDFQLPDVIHPRWSTGEVPDRSADYSLDLQHRIPNESLLVDMQQRFNEFGIVRVTNTSAMTPAAIKSAAFYVMGGEMNYEGGANPRNQIEPSVFEVGAPLVAWLHYHHEMAYVGRSPTALAFHSRQAASEGPTYFSDNMLATELLLATELGQKLKQKGVIYERTLTDQNAANTQIGVYNHWQQSFLTDDRDVAAQRAEARGLSIDWGVHGEMITQFRADAFEFYAPLNRNVLFASIADHAMWFDGWPLVMHLPFEQRPLFMTYGDGTPFTRDELATFVEVYDRAGFRNNWRNGDLVVFCNYRFAHGRPGIQLNQDEQRDLGVMLGPDFVRQGQLDTAW